MTYSPDDVRAILVRAGTPSQKKFFEDILQRLTPGESVFLDGLEVRSIPQDMIEELDRKVAAAADAVLAQKTKRLGTPVGEKQLLPFSKEASERMRPGDSIAVRTSALGPYLYASFIGMEGDNIRYDMPNKLGMGVIHPQYVRLMPSKADVREVELGSPVPLEELTQLPDPRTIKIDTVIAVPRSNDLNTFRYVLFKDFLPNGSEIQDPDGNPIKKDAIVFQGYEGAALRFKVLEAFKGLVHPTIVRKPTVHLGDVVPPDQLGDVPSLDSLQPDTILAVPRSADPTRYRYVLCTNFKKEYQRVDDQKRPIGSKMDVIFFRAEDGLERLKRAQVFRKLQSPVILSGQTMPPPASRAAVLR